MAEKETIVLPLKYYLDYFRFLIDFVKEKSGHLLGEVGEKFIIDFNALNEDAQCLLIRMANRKGEYFRLSKIAYQEIENIGAATDALIDSSFVTIEPPHDPKLFKLFTKGELDALFPERGIKLKKKEEILFELAEESDHYEYQKIQSFDTILALLRQEEIEFLKLLFFGHSHAMMTEFVIRDIGNVKLENLDGHEFTPWFNSHEEAKAVFELSKINRAVYEFIQIGLPENLLELINPINWSTLIDFPNARKQGDRLMLRLGEYFEKTGYLEDALTYYALAKKHPCRERQIRIFQKLGRMEEALGLAEHVFNTPFNASEKIFAKDYIAKTGARNLRSTTTRIKNSNEISVVGAGSKRVEEKALDHFSALGYEGIHSENYLWRAIFGLLFWNELFDSNLAAFHHPLQRAPSDLYSTGFYEARKEYLNDKIKSFHSKKQLLAHLKKTYNEKENISNPLVSWHEFSLPAISACIPFLPLAGLKKVMLEIAKNVKDNSTGFPDLFIWNATSYHFYEIKSPNDHLSSQQLFWLDFFEENQIKSDILRVNYH